MQKVITDDLDALLDVLPSHIRDALRAQAELRDLTEVVLDLGRTPEARFPGREVVLSPQEVTEADIDYVTARISPFGEDNRSGIERTLHRISAIRNRTGRIVGLTCRVGRAVFGTIKIIEDLVQSGQSILIMGRPGIGKTTMLREVARVLADDVGKRVIIVDTSNEIAGDGDIPHPAIGHARRMQVKSPTLQHAVMIEAVENHMPEVIVIDEIGTELEALAARTIAERGVQLVGTAHGNTLENLMMNPTLSDLIGGIQSVTLSDEEAKRRGTQKSVLERKSPPTFSVVVEIQDRERVAIHADVALAVDASLRGQEAPTEIRWVDETGETHAEKQMPDLPSKRGQPARPAREHRPVVTKATSPRLYLFGTNRVKLEEMAQERQQKLEVVSKLDEASLFVTTKSYYRQKLPKIKEAESLGIPVYVLKHNTPAQLRQLLDYVYPPTRQSGEGEVEEALTEAESAIERVQGGEEKVELNPQSSYIRRLQHLLAEKHHLPSSSEGREPRRRVRIYKGW